MHSWLGMVACLQYLAFVGAADEAEQLEAGWRRCSGGSASPTVTAQNLPRVLSLTQPLPDRIQLRSWLPPWNAW